MKNQDPDSRYQRYDFNVDGQKRRKHKKALIWPWILGMVIIVLALAFGIRYEINKHTNSQTKPTTEKVASSQKSTTTKDPKVENKKYKPAVNKNFEETNSKQTESKSVASKPDSASNSDQNTTTTATKSTAKTRSQNTDSEFAQSRTFNSVEDAKNWAKTTQSQWLAAGYNNYTITQNGQGFYVLTFVK